MERWSEVDLHLAGHLFIIKKQIQFGFVKVKLEYETFMNKLKFRQSSTHPSDLVSRQFQCAVNLLKPFL